jgi:hypothetical protein
MKWKRYAIDDVHISRVVNSERFLVLVQNLGQLGPWKGSLLQTELIGLA